jgi:hypothetical protein
MLRRLVLSTVAASAALLGVGAAVSAHIDTEPVPAALAGPVDVAPSVEPDADTSVSPATSDSEVVASGVDEPADPRTGTVMFIVSVAAVLGLGGFVVYRARQARAAAPTVD